MPRKPRSSPRQNKLFVRDRLDLLLDEDSFVEDGLLANALAGDLPADGVVTGIGRIDGRPVCVMANDSTVKAGSWGARTVEKIVRLTEHALRHELPVVYLVDSAGARITDQVELFPGRRGAGRIFANQVRLSGKVPQVCCLFGPSAAGGAYIPAFCDVVFMVEGNASMYLGSPRMAEVVIGEQISARGDGRRAYARDRQRVRRQPLRRRRGSDRRRSAVPLVSPDELGDGAAAGHRGRPACGCEADPDDRARRGAPRLRHAQGRRRARRRRLVLRGEAGLGAELIIGFARLDGMPVGIVANNPMHLGGVLFVDSADKAARFIWLCDAFNVPLLFLADVPGFMIGSQVERQGIIRHGAKMITAVAEATVPKISVIVRKAYGAGLYAMCGPAFDPDACLALPTAQIAVMGPDPAVNAVFYNRIQAIEDADERAAFVAEREREYEEDVDLVHLAAELVVDAVDPARRPPHRTHPAAGARGRPRARRRRQAARRSPGVGRSRALVCALQQVPHAVDRAARRDVPQMRPGRGEGPHPGHDSPRRRGADDRYPVAPEAAADRLRDLSVLALLPDAFVGAVSGVPDTLRGSRAVAQLG